LEPIKNKTDPK